MDGLLSIATGLTPVLQLVLILILAIIFWEPIATKIFGYEPKLDESGAQNQLLLAQMQELSQHFNHETTDNQGRIERGIMDMHSKQDKIVNLLSEIKEYGLRCRKE